MQTIRDLAARRNRAAQLNPEHPSYHRCRGLNHEEAARVADEVRRQHQADAAPTATVPTALPRKPLATSTPTGARKPR
jgi:hypothetical protein